ncbi:MAG: hydroxyphenylacetyl-CoA thioesterase PaaI [Actinomycetota bacterium]|nr:hydroxyphenylacetyl-CoA thioesterase PaaI [Actinomycetota bacterium]
MAAHGAIGNPGSTGAPAMMAADLASAGAGLDVLELGPGTATVTMTVRADMANGHGITHGGYVFLLADTAFACACNGEGAVTVATGADINFLAATRPGDVLTARAESRTLRGRSGLYDVTVTRRSSSADSDSGKSDTDSEVVAEFRGRSRTLAPRTARPSQAEQVTS